MAWRFDADADAHIQSSGVPSGDGTICGFARITTDRNTFSYPFGVDNNTTGAGEQQWYLETANDGTNLVANWRNQAATGGSSANIVNMRVGQWYFIAIRRSGTTLTGYARRVGSDEWFKQSSTMSGTIVPTVFHIGGSPTTFSGEFWNGRICGVRFWKVAITEAELLRESQQFVPTCHLNDLYGYWPNDTGIDFSGFGHHLTKGTATLEPGPQVPLRRNPVVVLDHVQSGGQTIVAVGQATETDLAQPIAWAPKNRLANQALETDTAFAITRVKRKTLGQALETDTAQPIGKVKNRAVGQALETDLAQPIGKVKQKGIGQATETDLAQSITVVQGGGQTFVAVNQATETDEAFSIKAVKVVSVGLATETDVAQPLVVVKRVVLGQAVETDVAQHLTAAKRYPVGLATESDVAQPIRPARVRGIGIATETDVAFALTRMKAKGLGLATETDIAFAITRGGVVQPAAKILLDANTGLLYYRFSKNLIIPLS